MKLFKATKKTFKRQYVYENLGGKIFTDQVLRNSVSSEVYNAFHTAIEDGTTLGRVQSDAIGHAIQKWAMSKGCKNYSHWFSPLRGAISAQKLDSFIDRDRQTLDLKVETCGTKMFRGETDGSSYPNGGLRETHHAASYTSWDPTSPPFIRNDTIYFPSYFVSWTGESMDTRTPLLRSQRSIDREASRLLRVLGGKEEKVISMVGWEQEFFVIDREHYLKRPDLIASGRTLIGALPSRNQQTETNYFGTIPLRVKNFLKDVQSELLELGVPMQVMHNEVAPGQHEICPIFTRTNVATDQNLLAMEVLSDLSNKHGLAVLFHEKPFKGLNGSGKHNNWGLETKSGINLFVPGKTETEQVRFLAFLAALTRTIDIHGDVLRIGVSTPANDYRLGAQEAPPAIISLYLGETLDKHIKNFLNGNLGIYTGDSELFDFGEKNTFGLKRSIEDRNRTAPFPYCGNRFEFRAVGSSQNIALPLSFLNTSMAESISVLADQIEAGKSIQEAIKDMFRAHYRVVFNGNGYSEEWKKEAKERGIWVLPQTIDGLKHLCSKKNFELFSKMKVLNRLELECRSNVMYDQFVHQTLLEADCMLNMITTGVYPAMYKDLSIYQNDQFNSKFLESGDYVKDKKNLYNTLIKENQKLNSMYLHSKTIKDDILKISDFCEKEIKPQMMIVREVCDKVERNVSDDLWPFPKYTNILFDHHSHAEDEFERRK